MTETHKTREVPFDKDEYNECMDRAADYLHDTVVPMVASLALDGKPVTFIMSALRKRLNGLASGKIQAAREDNRTREWKYNFAVYRTTGGVEGAYVYKQSDVVVVKGLSAVADGLQDFLRKIHAEEGFEPEDEKTTSSPLLKQRFGGMRPALSKYSGRATTNILYAVGDDTYMVFVRITHAELELDKALY